MKTKITIEIVLFLAIVILCIYRVEAQTATYGSGALNNSGSCTPAGNSGNCSDTYIGQGAGISCNSASGANTAVGYKALFSNAFANCNIAIGDSALYSQNYNISGADYSTFNIAVGNGSLFSNQPGNYYDPANPTFNYGFKNVAVGYNALYYNTSGYGNTATGHKSLYHNIKGNGNTAIGYHSLFNNTYAHSNTAIGDSALYSQSYQNGQLGWGTFNVAVGNGALYKNNPTSTSPINGIQNTATGYQALYNNIIGSYNTAAGYRALYSNTVSGNTAIGYSALKGNSSGTNNCAVGLGALQYNNSGNSNTANGYAALYKNVGGNYNTAMGWYSLSENTYGNGATAIGYGAIYYAYNGSSFTNCNIAVGYEALMGHNTSTPNPDPSWNTGNYNTALGYQTLYSNSAASNNVAIGYHTLFSQTWPGSPIQTYPTNNVAVGNEALYHNNPDNWDDGKLNTAVGYQALYENTTGPDNTATGAYALFNNLNGSNNTANGYLSLYSNQNGGSNTAIGDGALQQNTTIGLNSGIGNTALGVLAGQTNTIECNNTCIGYCADIPATYNDCTFLGYIGGGLPMISTSDQIQLGSTSITQINANVSGLTQGSDRRIKNNIKEDVPGLPFIKLLKPVTFNYNIHIENSILGYPTKTIIIPETLDTLGNIVTPSSTITSIDTAFWNGKYDIENIVQTGLIAQQVDSAAMQIGYDFNGIKRPNNANQLYGLNYTQFVIPLIKGEQELSKTNDSLKKCLNTIDSLMNQLKNKDSLLTGTVINLMTAVANCCTHGATNKSINNTDNNDSLRNILNFKLTLSEEPVLGDAQPNPNSGNTQIPYFLPNNIIDAQIIFTDILGKLLLKESLQPGYGLMNIDTWDLPSGIYTYSMLIDGKIFDSKKMIRNK